MQPIPLVRRTVRSPLQINALFRVVCQSSLYLNNGLSFSAAPSLPTTPLSQKSPPRQTAPASPESSKSHCENMTFRGQFEGSLILELFVLLQPYVRRGEMNAEKFQRRTILHSF